MSLLEVIERDHPYCAPGETLQQVAERMCLWGCDVLPVCDAGRCLVGSIATRAVCLQACVAGKPLRELHVADAAVTRAPFGRVQDSADVLMERMVRERVWQLPVVDASNRLLGVVSYHLLLGRMSGIRDILVMVEGSDHLDDVASACGPVPTWILVIRQRELISPDGVSSQLSKAELRLLLTLAERSGSVLGREGLTQSVLRRTWHPADRYVDVVVAGLRRKFGESAADARAIRTVPNEGYVLTLRVERPVPTRVDCSPDWGSVARNGGSSRFTADPAGSDSPELTRLR